MEFDRDSSLLIEQPSVRGAEHSRTAASK